MRPLNFDDVELPGCGGDFVRFEPGVPIAVYVLTNASMIPNKFTWMPKPFIAVWHTGFEKVMVMELKKGILCMIKMLSLDKDQVDWSRTVLKVRRSGSGKEDTQYVVFPQQTKPLDNYDKLQDEGNELLLKVSHQRAARSARIDAKVNHR